MPRSAVFGSILVVVGACAFVGAAILLAHSDDLRAFLFGALGSSALWSSRSITKRLGAR